MGLLSSLRRNQKSNKKVKLLVLGLDNSGKTSILKALSDEDISKAKPTQGFNLKNISLDGLQLSICDVGGQKCLREYWDNYYEETDALIYVIDSSDSKRLSESSDELAKLLQEQQLTKIPFLIFANKQDLALALSPDEISEIMKLDAISNRQWCIVACSAVEKEGLDEGLKWLTQFIQK